MITAPGVMRKTPRAWVFLFYFAVVLLLYVPYGAYPYISRYFLYMIPLTLPFWGIVLNSVRKPVAFFLIYFALWVSAMHMSHNLGYLEWKVNKAIVERRPLTIAEMNSNSPALGSAALFRFADRRFESGSVVISKDGYRIFGLYNLHYDNHVRDYLDIKDISEGDYLVAKTDDIWKPDEARWSKEFEDDYYTVWSKRKEGERK
ncbi:MAG: hypothetical protein V2A74_12180, partial [bacterium]